MTLTAVILMHVCVGLATESVNETDDDHNSLKVEIIDKPLSCEVTSQRGNVLKVHYSGYLPDGEKFDSRLVAAGVLGQFKCATLKSII